MQKFRLRALSELARELPNVRLADTESAREPTARPSAVRIVAPLERHVPDQLSFRFAAPRTRRPPTGLGSHDVSPRGFRGRHNRAILAELSDFPYLI
jgi:hypothetical protein